MQQLKWLMVLVGGVVAFIGGQEYVVSRGEPAEPIKVDLAAVEAGKPTNGNFVELGPHWAVYPSAIVSRYRAGLDMSRTTPETPISDCYYPIISREHPHARGLARQRENPLSVNPLVGGEPVPELKQFAVLVKTHRFATGDDVPRDPREEPALRGLVINQIDSLGTDERDLIHESFPQLDLDKVLIVEEGRQPAGMLQSLGMFCGGAAISIIGATLLIVGKLRMSSKIAARQESEAFARRA